MLHRRIFALAVVADFSTALACGAAAQSAPATPPPSRLGTQPFVEIGGVAAVHPAGKQHFRYDPAVRGVVPAASVTAGVYLAPAIAVEAVAVWEHSFSTDQRFQYFSTIDFVSDIRDQLLAAQLRWRAAPHLELTAGGGVAIRLYALRSQVESNRLFGGSRLLPDGSATERSVAVIVGLSAPFAVGSALSIVPTARVHVIDRESGGLPDLLGVGTLTVQVGVNLRFGAARP